MFFAKHKKESVVLMTALLIIAYIGRFTNLIWLFDVSMIVIAIIGGLPIGLSSSRGLEIQNYLN